MPLVSLKYFSSLLFSRSSSGVCWSSYGLFLLTTIIVMVEMSCWGEAFLRSIQAQNWSSFLKMLTAAWSPYHTNASSSPRVCFSLGCESCLGSKEPPSPVVLAGEAEDTGDSLSCSGCSFVDQGWAPHLAAKATWEPVKTFSHGGYTCTAPAFTM